MKKTVWTFIATLIVASNRCRHIRRESIYGLPCLLLTFSLFLCGCGTVYKYNRYQEVQNPMFIATGCDLAFMIGTGFTSFGFVALADFPFAVAFDVVALPYDCYIYCRNLNARVTLQIIDDCGLPISNERISVRYGTQGYGKTKLSTTDANSLYTVKGFPARQTVTGSVAKDGYYASTFKVPVNREWNPTLPIVLREKRNPIPMYVKRIERYIPKAQAIGFDCEKGDFIAPHGSGAVADFTIHIEGGGVVGKIRTNAVNIASLDPEGGFKVLKRYNDSDFKSEYMAPESGYSTNLAAASTYTIKGFEGTQLFNSGDEYLVFKSRIKRDKDGNVISANYGKIYGEFEYFSGFDGQETALVKFLYYFNPTPNNRNIEFDGENSLLLKGAKFIP